MTDRAQTTCDQCGQTDDHPKAHGPDVVPVFNEDGTPHLLPDGRQAVIPATKHHDCLSHNDERVMRESAQVKGAPKLSAVIDACKSGVKGSDLFDLIQSGDLPAATGKVGRSDA